MDTYPQVIAYFDYCESHYKEHRQILLGPASYFSFFDCILEGRLLDHVLILLLGCQVIPVIFTGIALF